MKAAQPTGVLAIPRSRCSCNTTILRSMLTVRALLTATHSCVQLATRTTATDGGQVRLYLLRVRSRCAERLCRVVILCEELVLREGIA